MIKNSELLRALYRNSLVFLIIYVTGSALSFGVHVLMARAIGPTSYGHFAYASSWIAILILGCHLGLKPTAIRFTAAYKFGGDWDLLNGLLRTASAWIFVASMFAVFVFAVVVRWTQPQPHALMITMLIVSFSMPFMAFSELCSSVTRGLGAIGLSQLPASIIQHAIFGLGLVIISMTGGFLGGAISAGAAFLAATFITMLSAIYFLRITLPLEVRASAPRHNRIEWAIAAGGNLMTSVFQAIRLPLVIIITANSVEAGQVALLVAAERFSNLASIMRLAVGGAISPVIAQHFASSNFQRLQDIAHHSSRATLAAALLIGMVLSIFGEALLHLFGGGFENAYYLLLFLVVGEIFLGLVGPVGYFLSMTGKQNVATFVEGVTSILAIAFTILLVPKFGVTGAAISIAISALVRSIGMLLATWHCLRIRSTVF